MSSFYTRATILLTVFVFLSGASAHADSFSFSGSATFGGDIADFFIFGPTLHLYSAAPGAPADLLFTCQAGTRCEIPAFSISAFASYPNSPGNFSGGTVNGVTAYALTGSIDFSPSFFFAPAHPNGQFTGTGHVTFSGYLQGFVFLPLGCETSGNCESLGPQVFDIFLSGSGTVTTTGVFLGEGTNGFFQVNYDFNSSPTPVPEPSGLLLFGSGLAGLAGWCLKRTKLTRP